MSAPSYVNIQEQLRLEREDAEKRAKQHQQVSHQAPLLLLQHAYQQGVTQPRIPRPADLQLLKDHFVLQKQRDHCEIRNSQLQQQLEDQVHTNELLSEEMQRKEVTLKQLSERISDLEKKEARLIEITLAHEDLTRDTQLQTRAREHLEERAARLTDDNKRLQKELDSLASVITELERQKATDTKALAMQVEYNDELRAKCNTLHKQLRSIEATVARERIEKDKYVAMYPECLMRLSLITHHSSLEMCVSAELCRRTSSCRAI